MRPTTGTAENTVENARVKAFFGAGYDYDDAVRLAKLWKKSDAYQAKIEGGKRLLVVDDEPAMQACYRRSFAAVGDGAALGAMVADLFGAGPCVCDDPASTMTHCHQGPDAVAQVERVLAAGTPYSVAFIDVRMPPGSDSRETARRIRVLDLAINLVGKAFRCWRMIAANVTP